MPQIRKTNNSRTACPAWRNMKKRISKQVICGLLLAFACAVSAGCGNGGKMDTPTPDMQASSAPETPTQDASPTDSADPDATPTKTPSSTPTPTPDIFAGIAKKDIKAGVSVHDPSIFVDNGTYYIYGSHMANAKSTDLRTWKYCGNGYSSTNRMFVNLFDKSIGIFDYAGDKGNNQYAVWAPHVIYNRAMGKYCMYMCTSSTYIKSSLCFATSDSPEGPFKWEANILYSGFTKLDIDKTDVLDVVSEEYAKKTYLKSGGAYENMKWPNCIDPTVFYDEDGRMWMVYGSWSGGIFLLEIDEQTGLPIHPGTDAENEVDAYFGRRLLGGMHTSIEGPYIEYNPENGYYYLFVSYGGLERTGGYQMRVFRAEKVTGPYVDMNGERPVMASHTKYGLKLSGNYLLPGIKTAYMATGGQSSFKDTDGKYYLCFHTRFDNKTEYHEPRVQQYFFNKEGWPVLAPYCTSGETLDKNGIEKSKLTGTYYFVTQKLAIGSTIEKPVLIELKEDGTVTGEKTEGTWTGGEGTCYMTITYDNTVYSGVFVRMKDQAGTDVICFTAAGDNKGAWGVHYEK